MAARRIRVWGLGVVCVGVMLMPAGSAPAATGSTARATRPPTSPPDMHRGGPHADVAGGSIYYSGNWSGYVATPKSGGATAFRYVVGSYTVPSVNCSASPNSFSYHWIGLDGWTDGTVEQDGIASECIGSTPEYYAWYELYPLANTQQIPVNAGDAITSSVYYNSSTRDYTLLLTDQTTGQGFQIIRPCPSGSTCENSSAEAITEGYYFDTAFAGTSDFGEQHFDTVKVTDSAVQGGGLSSPSWNTDESIAEGESGAVDTEPGPLYSITTKPYQCAFETTWMKQN